MTHHLHDPSTLADWDRQFRDYLNEVVPWGGGSRPGWDRIPHVDVCRDPFDYEAFRETPLAGFDHAFLIRNGGLEPLFIDLPDALVHLDELCWGSTGWNYLCGVGKTLSPEHFAEYGTTAGEDVLRVAVSDLRL